jgi:hypothetical protein
MTTLLPLCCFPNVAWFSAYCQAEHVVIDLGEHFIKQSYRNRFELLGSHGRLMCTVRVHGQKGIKTPTHQITIVNDEWRRLVLGGLTAGYARSPYFDEYRHDIETLLTHRYPKLVDLGTDALHFLMQAMGIAQKHEFSEQYVDADAETLDLRMNFKTLRTGDHFAPYPQVFEDRFGFTPNLSALDLVLNTGPEAHLYLDER